GDAFRRTYWVRHADTLSCPALTLIPGERSGWANYATVGNWYTPAPLWLGELKENAASGLQSLDLDLVLTFTDTKEREIRKRQSYYIKERK
ncbi:MAG: hypothetical protein JXR21_05410, partial [Candidatus Marinimicrobia bacterium]|nr:hypothetical protein [Candidatus Neomarinimicrobiota bacterium]